MFSCASCTICSSSSSSICTRTKVSICCSAERSLVMSSALAQQSVQLGRSLSQCGKKAFEGQFFKKKEKLKIGNVVFQKQLHTIPWASSSMILLASYFYQLANFSSQLILLASYLAHLKVLASYNQNQLVSNLQCFLKILSCKNN